MQYFHSRLRVKNKDLKIKFAVENVGKSTSAGLREKISGEKINYSGKNIWKMKIFQVRKIKVALVN